MISGWCLLSGPPDAAPSDMQWKCPECDEEGHDMDDFNEGARMCNRCVKLLEEEAVNQ